MGQPFAPWSSILSTAIGSARHCIGVKRPIQSCCLKSWYVKLGFNCVQMVMMIVSFCNKRINLRYAETDGYGYTLRPTPHIHTSTRNTCWIFDVDFHYHDYANAIINTANSRREEVIVSKSILSLYGKPRSLLLVRLNACGRLWKKARPRDTCVGPETM